MALARVVCCRVEDRLNIGWRELQEIESTPDFRADYRKFGDHLLRSGVVARGFEHQKIVVERAYCVADLLQVDAKAAIRMDHPGAFVAQVVELNCHASCVCVLQTKA